MKRLKLAATAILFSIFVEYAVADMTVRVNIVGPGTCDAPSEFSLATGESRTVTVTAAEGFVISSVVTNGAPFGAAGDFTGRTSATLALAPDSDILLTATFVSDKAWWLDPFVRNSVYVSDSAYFPGGCSIDEDESFLVVGEGDTDSPPGIYMYDVESLRNSVNGSLSPLKSDNVEFVEGESGLTVAVSSDFGAVFTNPTGCETLAIRPVESDWSAQENFTSVPVDNLEEWGLDNLECFSGGAFGESGFYVSDSLYINYLVPDVEFQSGAITNLSIGNCWECPVFSESLNVKKVNGIEYVYGVGWDDDGNSAVFVLDTNSGNISTNAFMAEFVDNDGEVYQSVRDCYSPVQIVGTEAGTPRLIVKDRWYVYVLDLDSDGISLVSPYPAAVFPVVAATEDLYDATIPDADGFAVTDDETRMFCLCGYDPEGGFGDGCQIMRIKVFEKSPEQFEIAGFFITEEGETSAGRFFVPAHGGTNIVFTSPQGVIESVTTNGVPVEDFTGRSRTYVLSSADVSRHVCVKMRLGSSVARIGETDYLFLEDAIAAASDGDTVELLAPASLDEPCAVDCGITIDTCGFWLTNNTVVTVGSTGALVITNSLVDTSVRSFVNFGRIIISGGGTLDIHAITAANGPTKDDLEDNGIYEIKADGFMILPDVFKSWCIKPEDIESEPGFNYYFFAGTEVGATIRISSGDEDGNKFFVCTDVTSESGHDVHKWNTVEVEEPDDEPVSITAAPIVANGKFYVTVGGTAVGRDYTAYTVSDLSVPVENWTAEQTLAGTGGSITFELDASGPRKFARVMSARHR